MCQLFLMICGRKQTEFLFSVLGNEACFFGVVLLLPRTIKQMTMWRCWMSFIVAWASLVTPALSQSGDADWGSGFGMDSTSVGTNDTSQTAGDESVRTANNQDFISSETLSQSPTLVYKTQPDKCSVYFSTKTNQRLKAYKEAMSYLQAIQHGNRAVMDNLVQYVGAELGQHSYVDIIKENIIGSQEEHKSCHETVEKAEEDLKKQLEGEALNAQSRMQKIREESLAFEDMLVAAEDIAIRLESSARVLHASFTRKLQHTVKTRQ